MASDSGGRRMVFDTRGRRRNVIRVVYAVLALLMGTSLFLVVGPFNLGELVGDSGSSSAEQVFEDQIERVERQLVKEPNNEQLLLTLTRAQINAGNAQIEPAASEAERPTVPTGARNDFRAAALTWDRYLTAAGGEPSPAGAQLVAGTFFTLAESSLSYGEAEESLAEAAEAQRIVAGQQPSVGSLTSLAIYEYFDGNFAAGDKAMKRATTLVPKPEAKNIEKQLDQYRKSALAFDTQKKRVAKAESKASKEQLQSPVQGLGLPGSTFGE